MRSLVLLHLFLLQVPLTRAHWEDYKYGHQGSELHKKSCCSWKCILFTLQWPGGFCQSLNKEIPCRIPESIKTWTIHGLWPLHAQHCCNCWPMFHSDIEDLEAELYEHWPSLITTKSSFHFWRDEWNKHGVCAACVEGMNSPPRYFQNCLKLQRQFDIRKLLEEANITPSCERPYKFGEVHSVLAPHLGNKLEIQCVKDTRDREVWFQLKIPLSQNLTVSCNHYIDTEADYRLGQNIYSGHPCPPGVPFYYFPINHQQPKQPCG
ncbi:ribonuclease T2-like isoform X2 [Echeneis naucrates]|uniref:Ribonuclease Oy-like n=2 Tax=Echeneis naucrates TaxID=173247 RepID=A0A665UIR2_ECHNA|nr:ribonuclease Oy-like isoform X2 [Echeneis naucrates]